MSQVTADGRSTRWADHRAQRRTELAQVARRVVHHRGADVSMDEIAAEAGTSKSIVYRYFEDKTGLQIAVAELVISDISAALDAAVSAADTPRAGLRAMIGVYLEMVEHSPNVYFFVTRPLGEDASGEVGHFIEAITRLVAAPFARVLSGTSGDGAAPPLTTAQADVVAAWAAGAVGFVRGVGEWWLTGGDGLTRAEL
ncbi:MAG: TetR/AcrR family transcriptional regulator, partial [Actinomycetota bacterium]|nr:TetR/AcrR family transcriptional regulator [Actinomycetota bacterium]